MDDFSSEQFLSNSDNFSFYLFFNIIFFTYPPLHSLRFPHFPPFLLCFCLFPNKIPSILMSVRVRRKRVDRYYFSVFAPLCSYFSPFLFLPLVPFSISPLYLVCTFLFPHYLLVVVLSLFFLLKLIRIKDGVRTGTNSIVPKEKIEEKNKECTRRKVEEGDRKWTKRKGKK